MSASQVACAEPKLQVPAKALLSNHLSRGSSLKDLGCKENKASCTGEKSIAKRVLRAAAPGLSTPAVGRAFSEADTLEELKAALQKAAGYTQLQKLGQVTMVKAKSVEVAFFAVIFSHADVTGNPRFQRLCPLLLCCRKDCLLLLTSNLIWRLCCNLKKRLKGSKVAKTCTA